MLNFITGTTKEQREAIKQLERQIEALQTQLAQRQADLNQAIELYRRSVSDKWEYLEVSNKNTSNWGSLDTLGSLGWELVGLSTYAEGGQYKTVYTEYVFKRKIPTVPQALLEQYVDMPQIKQAIEEGQARLEQIKAAR